MATAAMSESLGGVARPHAPFAGLRPRTNSFAISAGLATLGLVFVAKFPISHRSGLLQVEQYLLIAYTSVRIGMLVRRNDTRLVQLLAFLWVYTLFGLVQVVQLSAGDNPFHVAVYDDQVQQQLAIMLLGTFALDLVASATRRRGRPLSTGRQISLQRVLVLSWLIILATPFLTSRLGGLRALFGSRLYVSQAVGSFGGSLSGPSTASATIFQLSEVVPFLCLYALIRLRAAGQFTFSRNIVCFVTLVGLLVSATLFDNPISQPRFWIATIVISIALSGRWIGRTGFQAILIVSYIIGSIILFPFLDATRVSAVGTASIERSGIVDNYLNKTDYGTMQDVTNTVTYVEDRGFTDGRQLLGAVLFFVPRTLYPDKADDTAALLATNIGFVQNLNLDSPLWAEGYIDFGMVGVVGVLGLFGYFVGYADRVYGVWSDRTALASTVVPMFAGYELIILRGSLLQAIGRMALIVFLGLLISTKSRPAPAR